MRVPSVGRPGPLAVVASNAVAPVGVLAFGWSTTVLLGVFVLELAAVLCWAAVKVPFAAKRPNNAMDGHRLLGALQAKRGGIDLPGPLPPVYLRNLPTLVVLVALLAPIELGAAFLLFALADPTITAETTGQMLLGGVGVFAARGVETATDYFRDGGYRDHSPRSVILAPFKYVFGVGTLLFVVGSSGVDSGVVLALVVAGKLVYDLRTIQVERDPDRRGVFYRLYGSRETEIEPEPVAVPDGEPVVRARPSRSVAVADALYRGALYTLTSTVVVCYAFAAVLAVFTLRLALAPIAVVLAFGTLRAITRYLRYGPLEYRGYDGVLVAYDTLFDEPQERIERDEVKRVAVETDLVDRLFDTASVEFDRGDLTPELQFTVPDPDEVEHDDTPESLIAPYVDDPKAIADALGAGWLYERDVEGSAAAD
ncbi:hypothetical protein C475_00662 [Halosimplex carlsbadense 2-9-1]|uniref:Uncharacterized protein n=1 Tax=Halosimplex carlsbadense 2-9-1 TaxID=797114 RepID=M0D3U3_9EURY|nr:DUF6498-containing protein [Halosimplex carlsbadense]ELZ30201.1 hypothetical protein C475_00662 [Halosimplex carlsbadense 2-9-1]